MQESIASVHSQMHGARSQPYLVKTRLTLLQSVSISEDASWETVHSSAKVKYFVACYGIIHTREPFVVHRQKPGDYEDHQFFILHGRDRTSGAAEHQ